jgi:iron complex outermembrane receptor protein
MHRLSALAAVIAVSATPALTLAATSSLVLEEVVVTAQKKAESLSRAPLTVNLLSEDAIRDTAIFQGDELGKLTAGIEIRYEGDSNVGVGIRGIGTFAQQSAPPRVSTYLDNYFISGSQTDFTFAALFDTRQVQILRGPQGTLYGQPSPTGAVVIETADPNLDEIEGHIRASYLADPDGYNLQGAISVPIIEGKLAARLALLSDDRDTGTENIFRGYDEARNRKGVRAKLLWQPTDSFTAKLGYTWMRTENSDTLRIVESTDPASDFQLDASDRASIIGSPDEIIDKKDFLATLQLDWELDWGSISWFSGDFGSDNTRDDDLDNTQYPNLVLDNTRTKFAKNVQHELRISLSPTDWWDVQFGGFYQDSLAISDVSNYADVPNTGTFEILLDIPTASETTAIFAHNDFHISDATTLTVGLRYNKFEQNASNGFNNNFLLFGFIDNDNNISDPVLTIPNALACVINQSNIPQDIINRFPAGTCVNNRSTEDKEWTGTIKLAHSFSDAANLYITLDHGFRPGAPNFDTNGAFQPTEEDPDSGLNFYEGETVNSFEIGLKGSIFEGRGQYSGAIFYSIYDDYQIRPTFEVFNGAGNSVSTISNADVNVEEATQSGFEAELRYLATENLELFGSFTYSKVELTAGSIPCTDASQEAVSASNRFNVCDADGMVGSQQPEIFLTFKADYSKQMAFGGEWYASGLFNYRGDIEAPGDITGRFASDSYTTVDLFTGIRTEQWDAQLFIKNASNEEGIIARRPSDGANTSAAANGGVALYNNLTVTPPRTIGVTASYRF